MFDDLKTHDEVMSSSRGRLTNIFDATVHIAVRVHTVGGFNTFLRIVNPITASTPGFSAISTS